ncbi:hypothetical protein LOZ12_006689 [Ophidiomyces ophidiicola]|uniref:Uncharacterized protein n=1 Tax=Ophidiomyces ophidiicola TaxID=1387563 RepID=A0ACB8UP43_9EURO|nr:hypothetical protein LOZ62_006736 [Ophidiomyces ophidiicola]KAI1962086.1 hypothetical protein LOZ56_006661 [Ophidiomyces ophidiicola]KAI1998957.1 hypothetical protein LOZ50_006704 [Ophidiomyces ophidiicola]KAI2008079.1 hypothetical protein LOZ46_006694 [Ophidiomyces ophidiicola]KAI2017412.1 hypothetical protein LOZ45_006310 [Ophidiomyces ophidiicola]
MIISSRRDPYKMGARRAPTPSNIRVAPPPSKQSLRIPFIDSPLPSPSLPSFFPRRPTKPSRSRIQKSWRVFGVLAGCCIAITWLLYPFWRIGRSFNPAQPLSNRDAYEIVGSNVLPDMPGPVMVMDKKNHARWTIYMPMQNSLQTSPSDYARICMETEELAHHVAQTRNPNSESIISQRGGFYNWDRNFIDVADAQDQDLLPRAPNFQHNPYQAVGWEQNESKADLPLCKKSLTFVLQSDNAGLGATLMGLWMSYGLAKEEGRAFFIDDSNWGYGRYTSYFRPPPVPACRPPPTSQRIPCPMQARHLLVSPSTTRWVFDSNFSEKFENRHQLGVDKQRPIFEFLRTGYEALFQLNDQDQGHYDRRVKQLNTIENKPQVGIHVRRGDCHPLELQYENSYIPLAVYTQQAEELVKTLTGSNLPSSESGTTIVASDDPDIYSAPEVIHAQKAQSSISLVSKSTLKAGGTGQGSSLDSNSGWEGGFFNSLFWSLGSPLSRPVAEYSPPPSRYPASASSPDIDVQSQLADQTKLSPANQEFRFQPPQNALRLREFVARAYLLDLAILGSSDAVVCGVSSSSCRLLAVMLGWEKAIKQKQWKNIDGSLQWEAFIW